MKSLDSVRRLGVSAALLLAVVAAAGCATSRYTTGTPIRNDDVQTLVKGKTTMGEVIGLFGEPTKTVPMGEETIYTYEYKVTKGQTTSIIPGHTDTDLIDQVDKLSLTFDRNKVLSNYRLVRGIK